MRLKLKTLASLKPAGVVALALTLSASGRMVFASEQQAGRRPVTTTPAASGRSPPDRSCS